VWLSNGNKFRTFNFLCLLEAENMLLKHQETELVGIGLQGKSNFSVHSSTIWWIVRFLTHFCMLQLYRTHQSAKNWCPKHNFGNLGPNYIIHTLVWFLCLTMETFLLNIRLEAFTATELDKIFSSNNPCQLWLKTIKWMIVFPMMMEAEIVSEKLSFYPQLTRLVAREYFIDFY
jgi:hypothetical protein